MATIAEKLQILKDSTDAIKQAIIDKGGKITGGLSSYANAISKIGANKEKKDVNFYDYDGTILHSYTKDEFLALTSLPELPSHEGLICQEWNWVFEDAKEYVQDYGKLNIGATYITDDGKTRLYIKLLNDGMEISLRLDIPGELNGTALDIDWGDGNTYNVERDPSDQGDTVTFKHNYDKAGFYIITLDCKFKGFGLGHNSSSYNVLGAKNTIASGSLYKVEIGSNMSISNYAFNNCCLLQSVTIPNSVTSIGDRTFYGCRSLSSFIIPNSITSINGYILHQNYSLTYIIFPNSVTSIDTYAFYQCYSIQYYDFTLHTSVPTLSNKNAFSTINTGCEIRVPVALYEEWKAATNWSTYADYIVSYEG